MAARLKSQTPLVCHGHTRPIVDLQYSAVTPDGYFLISASKDAAAQLRNGETGDWIGSFLGHKGAVWGASLNDPALLAGTASADFTARVWNAVTGDELHAFEHKHIVRTVDFAHGDTAYRMVTGGPEKLLRIFDLARPEADPQTATAPAKIAAARYLRDNSALLLAYSDRPGVDVLDARTLSVTRTLSTTGPVTSIDVLPGGDKLVTADGSKVQVWDARTFEERSAFAPEGYKVESAALAPSCGRIVAGGDDMWVHLYDGDSFQELEAGRGHHGPVHIVRFAPGEATFASGSEDGTIRIWQTQPPQQAAT